MSSLLYGIEKGKGFILITGSVGTGKTTILRTFLQRTDSEHIIISIINPKTSFSDVLELLGKKLFLDQTISNQLEWIDLLKERLLELNNQGRRVIILIDEAHLLQEESLEEIRLLSNIEHDKKKLIQIILSGQNEIYELLARKRQKSLLQRIVINRQLLPLNKEETDDYIKHRLLIAGCNQTIFTKDALKLIWGRSQGAPRLINQLCDNALLIGYATESSTINKTIIKEVINDMERGLKSIPQLNRWQFPNKALLAMAASIILAAGIVFWGGKQPVATTVMKQPVAAAAAVVKQPVATAVMKVNERSVITPKSSPATARLSPAVNSEPDSKLSTRIKMLRYPGIIKVKSGEFLSSIAFRAYGTASETIIDFLQRTNDVRNINKIYSGQTMRLPLITRDTLISQADNRLFHIHYASFYSEAEAKNITHGLQSQGKDAYVVASSQGENRVYRVYIGDFDSRNEAENALNTISLKYLEFLNGNIYVAANQSR